MLASSSQPDEHVKLALLRNFEFKLPLAWLLATPSAVAAERNCGTQGRRAGGRVHQQAAPALQPMAEPAAGGFVAAGRVDRTAGAERRGLDFRGVTRDFSSRQRKTPDICSSGVMKNRQPRISNCCRYPQAPGRVPAPEQLLAPEPEPVPV